MSKSGVMLVVVLAGTSGVIRAGGGCRRGLHNPYHGNRSARDSGDSGRVNRAMLKDFVPEQHGLNASSRW